MDLPSNIDNSQKILRRILPQNIEHAQNLAYKDDSLNKMDKTSKSA